MRPPFERPGMDWEWPDEMKLEAVLPPEHVLRAASALLDRAADRAENGEGERAYQDMVAAWYLLQETDEELSLLRDRKTASGDE